MSEIGDSPAHQGRAARAGGQFPPVWPHLPRRSVASSRRGLAPSCPRVRSSSPRCRRRRPRWLLSMPQRQAEVAVSIASIARIARSVGLTVRPDRPFAPNVFSVVLYCAGFIGSVAGYAWLALTNSSVTRQDVVVQWGLLDKRQLTFAYLVVVAFVIFHHAMARFVFDRRDAGRGAGRRNSPSSVGHPPARRRAHRHPRLLLDRRCRPARRNPR